jgi:hypothetical protein
MCSKKEWEKSDQGTYDHPKKVHTHIEYCAIDNSIYGMKWTAHTLGTFSPFVFTLDFQFLDFYASNRLSCLQDIFIKGQCFSIQMKMWMYQCVEAHTYLLNQNLNSRFKPI